MKIRVCGPKDKPKDPNAIVLNVTSSSKDPLTRSFSPFLMGPVKLYGPYGAFNVENAWQYSKVYDEHHDSYGVFDSYWDWALQGWGNKRGVRYPMGKGRSPTYSLWDGEVLDYIEARKQIYIPLYKQAVNQDNLLLLKAIIKSHLNQNKEVYLFDFDGYDHVKLGMTMEDVINDPTRKMGHGFVLAQLLED